MYSTHSCPSYCEECEEDNNPSFNVLDTISLSANSAKLMSSQEWHKKPLSLITYSDNVRRNELAAYIETTSVLI